MLRCDKPAGRYEVRFEYLTKPYNEPRRPDPDNDYQADIFSHEAVYDQYGKLLEAAPVASEINPYVGELCECEVEWLRQAPGQVYSRHRRYTVRKLSD